MAAARTPASDAVLDAGLSRLVATATDPNSAAASAGTVALLAAAATARGGRELRSATRAAAGSLERSLHAHAATAPGLAGAPGALWALVEAARAVEDKALGWRALGTAAAVPVRAAGTGLAHGTAGTGLAHLRLWLAYRDPRSRNRVRECVEELLAVGAPGGDDGRGDGGVGMFLLAAGRAAGLRAALRAADSVAAALHAGHDLPTDPEAGAFLVRHWVATGAERSRALAEAATVAADPDPATGHLLLDLATASAEEQHRQQAGRLVTRMRRRTDPDALGLRLRLRHGGPRPWTAGDGGSAPLANAC